MSYRCRTKPTPVEPRHVQGDALDRRVLGEGQNLGSYGDVGAIIHYALLPMHITGERGNATINVLVLLIHSFQGVMNYSPYRHFISLMLVYIKCFALLLHTSFIPSHCILY